MDYEAYKLTRRFPGLDGLRAIAVLLVMTVHTGEAHADFFLWPMLNGQMGVPIFFVLSGFLITTLLVRERESSGRVSLKAFYVRRVMRLAPLYYLTICVYTLLVFAPNLPEALERRADMMRKIPFLVTYMSEYVPLTKYPVFGQAWSLGIEEKFYLAWPTFAFVLLSSNKSRIVAAIGLSIVLGASSFLGVFEVFGKYYAELFVGCALALALNDRRSFERLAFLGTRVGQTIAFVVAILVQVLPVFAVVRSSALYGIVAGGIIASAAIGERSIWLTVLRSRVMVYIGQRSYALYLIHVLIVHVVVRARIFPAHTTPAALASFAVTLGLALVVAEGLYRLIEGPCIRRGHAWSSALQARRPVPEIAPG